MQEDYYCDGYTVWYICFVAVFVGSLWAVAVVSHAAPAFAVLFCQPTTLSFKSVSSVAPRSVRSSASALSFFSADNVGGAQGAKSDRSSLACFALTLGLIIIYVRPRPRPLKRV